MACHIIPQPSNDWSIARPNTPPSQPTSRSNLTKKTSSHEMREATIRFCASMQLLPPPKRATALLRQIREFVRESQPRTTFRALPERVTTQTPMRQNTKPVSRLLPRVASEAPLCHVPHEAHAEAAPARGPARRGHHQRAPGRLVPS